MTDVHIFLNSNYDWENSIITSSLVNYQCLSEFCNAKYISIIENKQRITRKNNYQWISMLPYNRPDCNITPEDKANAHCPTFSAGRPNYSSKCNTRCLCSPSGIIIQARPGKNIKINSNKKNALLRPPGTQLDQKPERKLCQKGIYSETKIKVWGIAI